MESMRKIREELTKRLEKIEKEIDFNHKVCKNGVEVTNDHIDKITLKYKEDIVDLKASTKGFERELVRHTDLFK